MARDCGQAHGAEPRRASRAAGMAGRRASGGRAVPGHGAAGCGKMRREREEEE